MKTQGEVEQEIEDIVDLMETLTDEYAAVCQTAADSEVTYRVRFYRGLLSLKEQPPREGTRALTDKAAEAKATVMVEGELRAYKRSAALQESCKQALRTHQSRLDALRTLSANIRGQS